ncbi:calcineurin-like phosphoesterase family protein [Tautonia sp. JC769]|uniref:calcineurin-like phosphoesterase family protein n=1 Tax=Tautonia sp. JC769 TaxID=3232135 RepID=UPI0034596B11
MTILPLARFTVILALPALLAPALRADDDDTASDAQPTATGVVFHDRDGDGLRGDDEEGIADVKVSNGRAIVKTDADGRYELPIDDDTILFVLKPRGWMTPLNEDNLPQFYYIHKPAGSPESRFPGVEPTGPLPDSVDFPLHPQAEPEVFRALFFGDTQPRDVKEVEYIAHDIIEPILAEGTDASFGVTLGDIVFDDLSVMQPLNRAIALLGLPWYNVIGNHDTNQDALHDDLSDETFERIYGPSYYSFDHGPVHFMVLDDIMWYLPDDGGRGRYKGGLGERQMEFIRNDLAMIPEDQLVVLMMHIPLVNVEDRHELYRLIEQRPFALSVSAHTHYQEHVFIGEDDDFHGAEPHHHVINVTTCGSWWGGAPNELGIPHTTMRDGAPNGYSVFTFDGQNYDIEFRAARQPATHQMTIFTPEVVPSAEAGSTEVLVNVFAGSERSTVEMSFGDSGTWTPLEHAAVEDPYYLRMKALEEGETPPPGRRLPNVITSPHIWRGTLPANPEPGTHALRVRTTDMFGKTYEDIRSLRIE